MGKLSVAMMERLQPIADAIDEQLRKEQHERINFMIECHSPSSMKNNLVLYKTLLRRDWNSKFFMKKTSTGILIDFHPKAIIGFTINRQENTDYDPNSFNISIPRTNNSPAMELNDIQLTQHLLMENPAEVFVQLSSLEQDTQRILAGDRSIPNTALLNFLGRRGYKYSIHNNLLRIFT